jgi:hypothetical protein
MKDNLSEELERVFNEFPKYHMNILFGDFNAKVGKENIFKPTTGNDCTDLFKPTTGNESLHGFSNGNGVRPVNFATSKNLTV